jgi:hypothetical protein
MTLKIFTSSLVAGLLFLGCDGGSSDAPVSAATVDGQFVDSYVQNADYVCGNSATVYQTGIDGKFSCQSLPISFKIGGLKLGEITALPSDALVFPQDLLGLERTEANNTEVVAMARFLQSCDENNNTSDGLQISQAIKDSLSAEGNFNADDIESYTDITVDAEAALEHLTQTTTFIDAVNAVTKLPENVRIELLTAESVLTQDLKDTLSYMQNEERLAFDVYSELYKIFPSLNQLNNIAQNSESTHIQTVELLILKYINSVEEFSNLDLNTDLSETTAGEYGISAISNLYEVLMSKGSASAQDALEVGCMVEVTDINDLEHDITLAQTSNASDVEAAFVYLRNGSYNHYWAFDKGLKSMGVTDGCCVLGTEYCHPEYPTK